MTLRGANGLQEPRCSLLCSGDDDSRPRDRRKSSRTAMTAVTREQGKGNPWSLLAVGAAVMAAGQARVGIIYHSRGANMHVEMDIRGGTFMISTRLRRTGRASSRFFYIIRFGVVARCFFDVFRRVSGSMTVISPSEGLPQGFQLDKGSIYLDGIGCLLA